MLFRSLANAIGCKWDTIKAFLDGDLTVSVTRFMVMVEELGGQVRINWNEVTK